MFLRDLKTTRRGRSAVPWISLPNPAVALGPLDFSASPDITDLSHGLCPRRLSGFPADLLTLVPNPLALVGLRGSERADLRSRLSYLLFVGARNHDGGLIRARQGDAVGRGIIDGVGVTHLNLESLPVGSAL